MSSVQPFCHAFFLPSLAIQNSGGHPASTVPTSCILSVDTAGDVLQAEDCVVKQVQVEKDALLAQVRGQMSDMQRQHDHMAAELHRKLTW